MKQILKSIKKRVKIGYLRVRKAGRCMMRYDYKSFMKKKTTLITMIIIVLLVGSVFFLKEKGLDTKSEDVGLGTFLYQDISQQKASLRMPEINPFKFETNPIKQVKINPFE